MEIAETINMKTPSKNSPFKKVNFDPADTAKVQREMYAALKARREALEEALRKHTEELKLLCIKEGELTGQLPPEMPLAPGEEAPVIRRRVGTAFSLSADVVSSDKAEDISQKLELELELQKQITNAAHKLASDKSVSRFVRKQRRHSFIKAQNKLKDMEKKLSQHQKGKMPSSPGSTGKYDGMYCVANTEQSFSPFSDDMYLGRVPRPRQHHHVTLAHRLSRSFREKNLLRFHRLVDSGVRIDRTSDAHDTSDVGSSVSSDSQLEDSRVIDRSVESALNDTDESYELSSDSLYPSTYIPEDTLLDLSFLTPPPVPKRQDKTCMSPNTRRSKRASWHHTMFQKLSPQVVRANKETAV